MQGSSLKHDVPSPYIVGVFDLAIFLAPFIYPFSFPCQAHFDFFRYHISYSGISLVISWLYPVSSGSLPVSVASVYSHSPSGYLTNLKKPCFTLSPNLFFSRMILFSMTYPLRRSSLILALYWSIRWSMTMFRIDTRCHWYCFSSASKRCLWPSCLVIVFCYEIKDHRSLWHIALF